MLAAAEAKARLAGITPLDSMLRHGSLAETAADLEPSARLFVLGHRREHDERTPINHHVEGVVRSVKAPVLVLPSSEFQAPQQVVIAFDGSAHGMNVVNRLAASPLMPGLPIQLATAGAAASTEAATEDAMRTLRGRGFVVTTKMLDGEPATAISILSNRAGTVLMIGAYGHSRIRQLIIGSTTTTLLRHAKSRCLYCGDAAADCDLSGTARNKSTTKVAPSANPAYRKRSSNSRWVCGVLSCVDIFNLQHAGRPDETKPGRCPKRKRAKAMGDVFGSGGGRLREWRPESRMRHAIFTFSPLPRESAASSAVHAANGAQADAPREYKCRIRVSALREIRIQYRVPLHGVRQVERRSGRLAEQCRPTPMHAPIESIAALLFAIALLHTFTAKQFERLAHRYPKHAGIFHFLGEVEVVFGLWAVVLVALMAVVVGGAEAIDYAESRNYTEPLFVFVVMVMAASKPIVQTIGRLLDWIAQRMPVRTPVAAAWLGLAAVPLLGSLITEPAAMTIAALMLADQLFRKDVPEGVKYLALGVLFVNVSIGGTLTSYAAPPVLMVAATWGWDSWFMLTNFGWKSALAVIVNATLATFVLRKYLTIGGPAGDSVTAKRVPSVLVLVHVALLAAVIASAHHPVIFLGIFLLFLGIAQAYRHHQNRLILKEALLVGFFLAGLVVLGGMQQWWLRPIVEGLEPLVLFFGALGLTAITDNAALTYLGSLIEGISDPAKYMLVAGAVTGGGLTVIANAPNPAGVSLLKGGFKEDTISIGALMLGALAPTAVAAAALLLL